MLICSLGGVYAGGESTSTQYEYYEVTTYQDIAYATESGHFNISFDNGYNGYCFEYGEEEATKGDKFYVEATDYVLNTEGKDVSNLLKIYFVDYYNETQRDKIVTQHTIWHFTDNFDGTRVNKTLVNDIRQTSEYKKLPDDGTIPYNQTHNMFFSFKSLISPFENHQNFFGYKISFNPINEQDNCENSTQENSTININNTTNNINNTTNNINNTTNNINNTTNNINNTTNNINNTTTNNINNTINIINNTTNTNITNLINNSTTNITNILNINNTTIINTNHIPNNTTNNQTTYIINIILYKLSHSEPQLFMISTQHQQEFSQPINLADYQTGNHIQLLIITCLILAGIIYYRYK